MVDSTEFLYGYVGKIARINLTDQTTDILPTSRYVPKYIGGRSVCNRIFYDEVGLGVKAFDPENKIIYMTGATTATGVPTGGRSVFGSIAPNSYPEMYAWSGIGGWMGAELKFAGYDGFIIEGKAEKPSYVFIDDDKISFCDAEPLWGGLVHVTQRKLEGIHGKDIKSVVIGPAGENLMRNASVTTSNDNVAAKAGLGAVFGSKNLKAIAVRGTGTVRPYDINRLFELRMKMGKPYMRPNPVIHEKTHGMGGNQIVVEGGWDRGQVACSHGCNQHCCRVMMNIPSAFPDKKTVTQMEKCVGIFAYGFHEDCSWLPLLSWETEKNTSPPCKMLASEPPPPDLSDPYFPQLMDFQPGDIVDYWQPDFHKGSVMMHLCNEYGIDKWDVIVWFMTWLSMAKKEGLLDDLDFGMEINVENEEFVRYFLDMITYRRGKWGELFGEGMARAIRTLGIEKYGKTIYHGRYSQCLPGTRLDIPVSLEAGWGMSFHWQGRGYEATINKPGWLAVALMLMTSTRDMQTVAHFKDTMEHLIEIGDDPCHSAVLIDGVIMNENKGELKDSVSCCEWQSPDLFWTSMEAEMYECATGISLTEEELNDAAVRSKLLMRAIEMRNYGRDREMEVSEIFPGLTYPDPRGETVSWEEWNDFADLYYERRGWDKATGWPTRETWEKYGLSDIADDMEKIGKLPR
jgi:aldehyde:ferredoxin oxidoreductase